MVLNNLCNTNPAQAVFMSILVSPGLCGNRLMGVCVTLWAVGLLHPHPAVLFHLSSPPMWRLARWMSYSQVLAIPPWRLNAIFTASALFSSKCLSYPRIRMPKPVNGCCMGTRSIPVVVKGLSTWKIRICFSDRLSHRPSLDTLRCGIQYFMKASNSWQSADIWYVPFFRYSLLKVCLV